MAAKRIRQADQGLPEGYFSLEEIYLAYRKAKVDIFYERELCAAFEFVEFEEDLHHHLKAVHAMLLNGRWIDDQQVLGSLSFIPKSLDFESSEVPQAFTPDGGFACKTIQTVPARSWVERVETENRDGRLPIARFRAIARPSIAWLVISALWIMKAGRKLDARLGECARGSRLWTHKDGGFNQVSHGSFARYAPAYSSWREDGLRAIRHEVDGGRESIAITADLRSFYHCVDPDFLSDPRFKKLVRKKKADWDRAHPDEKMDAMQPLDWRFTEQMAASFKAWAELNKDLLPGAKAIGLPIGPGASRVVANLALIGFDHFIEHEVQPLYYGRYVDDVFLVLRGGTGLTTGSEVWQRIQKLSEVNNPSPCSIRLQNESQNNIEQVYRVFLDYDQNQALGEARSDLRFAGKKQKIFFIEGEGGKALVDAIEEQIRETSSEWRQLPELASSDEEFQNDFMAANPDVTEPADNLRKADKVSVRRLRFALHLRDLEAFAEDLEARQWAVPRQRLYDFTETQLLALPEFFVHATYLPRVIGIAAQARDWKAAQKLVRRVAGLFKRIKADCGPRLDPDHLRLCRQDIGAKLVLAICRALPRRRSDSIGSVQEFEKLNALLQKEFKQPSPLANGASNVYRIWGARLFDRDLARLPFRQLVVDGELASHEGDSAGSDFPERVGMTLCVPTIRAFLKSISGESVNVPMAMVFPTRPLSPAEIGMLDSSLLSWKRASRFQRFVRAIRGTHFAALDDVRRSKLKKWHSEAPSDEAVIWVPDAEFGDTVRISLPCIALNDESWVASIVRKQDPDGFRYTRITRLLNEVLRSEKRPHYIVLPELSLKRKWFRRFAHKLEKSGISLISGVEYAHAPFEGLGEKEVINSVMVSLVTRFPGYRTHLLYSQNKLRPAPAEREGLKKIGGMTLAKGGSGRMIIRHGEFQFAILICSELSDIESRAKLRGNIDALFVPEWNKDTEGFSSLVESTALDLHCFVIQSNNRRYGDSRIRGPHKEAWERDILRLKGGCQDFHASGEIDYIQLRRFQSNHHSLERPFKPVPDGFTLHPSRVELPLAP